MGVAQGLSVVRIVDHETHGVHINARRSDVQTLQVSFPDAAALQRPPGFALSTGQTPGAPRP